MWSFTEQPIYAHGLKKHLNCCDNEPGTGKKLVGRGPRTAFLDIDII
jgi:hypothetical protein